MPGDSVLLQRAVDFIIELDVEGMELQALAGLERTIARWRPRMFIEVDDGNVSAFKEWLVRHHYVSERTYPTLSCERELSGGPLETIGVTIRSEQQA